MLLELLAFVASRNTTGGSFNSDLIRMEDRMTTKKKKTEQGLTLQNL